MISRNEVFIGVVIPTYNERENIVKLLDSISRILSENGFRFKILVVDDNSPDGTAEVVREYGRKTSVVEVLVRPGKMGIGSAVVDGMKKLLGDSRVTHIITMDADFSHRPEDLPILLKYVGKADIVQGSRYIEGGRIIGWSLHRRLISWGANLLVKLLYHTGLKDNTGNYRVYSREAATDIIKYSKMKGYEWVIEALLIALARGYRVVEAPIVFINRGRGASKLGLRDILEWFKFIISYRKQYKQLMRTTNI
ncbi:MAG: glycosyl transferase [Desulfurococcales archaeon ex4484_58]|nr:MAG: glycosyl transferase [Desulfurococcales archaeon ex4484_58]